MTEIKDAEVGARFLDIGGAVYNVKHPTFGAAGDGTTDDTAAIQAAIEAAEEVNGVVVFPDRGPYVCGVLLISDSISIIGYNTLIEGNANAIFGVDAALDWLFIDNIEATFPGVGAVEQGREFFVNYSDAGVIGENTTNFPDVGATQYTIEHLKITNCRLHYCKVTISGTDTVAYITDNIWTSDSGDPQPSPAFLQFLPGVVDGRTGQAFIKNNRLSVYPPDGGNVDIVKISRGAHRVVIDGNYFENLNTNAVAEVDVFTGGYGCRFVNNIMINTGYVRKQTGTTDADLSYDLVSGNFVELQDGYDQVTAFILRGTLFTATNNQILLANTTTLSRGFLLDNEENYAFDDFLTDKPTAFVLMGNLCDMRDAHATSQFIRYEGTNGTGGKCSIIGNVVLGGERFISGTPQYSAQVGNIWASSDDAAGTSINHTAPSTFLGNIVDTASPATKSTLLNYIATNPVTLANDATPSVLGLHLVKTGGTTTITDFDDGVVGQRIVILAEHSLDIADGTPIILNGGGDYSMTSGDTLELVMFNDQIWHEVTRSVN